MTWIGRRDYIVLKGEGRTAKTFEQDDILFKRKRSGETDQNK